MCVHEVCTYVCEDRFTCFCLFALMMCLCNPPSVQIDNAKVWCLCEWHVVLLWSPVFSALCRSECASLCVFYLGECVCEGERCANVKHVWPCLCVNLPCVCLDYADYCLHQVFVWADVCLACSQSALSQPSIHSCLYVLLFVCYVFVRMLAGMSVSAIKDGTGMLVRSVVQGGSVCQDGRLGVGDVILAINGEPTSNLTSTQARAMLRRNSVLGPEMR